MFAHICGSSREFESLLLVTELWPMTRPANSSKNSQKKIKFMNVNLSKYL